MDRQTVTELDRRGFPLELAVQELLKTGLQNFENSIKKGAVAAFITNTRDDANTINFTDPDDWAGFVHKGIGGPLTQAELDDGVKQFINDVIEPCREGDFSILVYLEGIDEQTLPFLYHTTISEVRMSLNTILVPAEAASEMVEEFTGIKGIPTICQIKLPNDSNGRALRNLLSRSDGPQ